LTACIEFLEKKAKDVALVGKIEQNATISKPPRLPKKE